jgi:lipoprotein-anchoring transpeptidase ErfK/SrfK
MTCRIRVLFASLALLTVLPTQPRETQAAPPIVREALAVQIMLDRIGFSPGEIDGQPGRNFKGALLAFQRAQQLPPTGDIDGATWDVLMKRSGGQQPLVTYKVTDEDVAGPFTPSIPRDLMKQATLPSLGYRSPLEALAEKFHCSPQFLRARNAAATFNTAGEQLLVPNVAAPDPTAPPPGAMRPPASIVVSTETSALTVEDDNSAVLFHAPVTVGSTHDPLPIGTWAVTGVRRLPEFHYNPDLFWDANSVQSQARIAPGPNNPVGVVWIDLTKEHYGIHGTPEPSRIGHTASHGCVRLTNWDADRVAQWARPGLTVVFK